MKNKRIGINIRLDPEEEADRRAWVYLQRLDRKVYKSYGKAIIVAINDFFDRQEQLAADSYLETREKEDAFLQSVLETITKGLQGTARLGIAGGPMPYSLETTTSAAVPPPEDTAKQDEAVKAALDFLDSF